LENVERISNPSVQRRIANPSYKMSLSRRRTACFPFFPYTFPHSAPTVRISRRTTASSTIPSVATVTTIGISSDISQSPKRVSCRAFLGAVRGITASDSGIPPSSRAVICRELLAVRIEVPSLPGSNSSTSSRPMPSSRSMSGECVLIMICRPERPCIRPNIWGM